MLTTGRGLDATIQGRGFFVTRDTTGVELYTRVGIFAVDKDGYLVDSVGRQVQGYAPWWSAGVPVPGAALGAMGDLQGADRPDRGAGQHQLALRRQPVGRLDSARRGLRSTSSSAPAQTRCPTTAPSVSVVYDSLGCQAHA